MNTFINTITNNTLTYLDKALPVIFNTGVIVMSVIVTSVVVAIATGNLQIVAHMQCM